MHTHTYGTPVYNPATGKYTATCTLCPTTVTRSDY